MTVIADASPIHYLVLIGRESLLPQFYKHVIPDSVASELRHWRAPAQVRIWMNQPPVWCEVHPDPAIDPSLSTLDPGERATIGLAESLSADRLLIDERTGLSEAERRGLRVCRNCGNSGRDPLARSTRH